MTFAGIYFVACLVVSSGVAFAQVQADEPIQTTLCELMKAPPRFNGKMVQVRARIVGDVIADDTCPGTIWLSVGDEGSSGAQEFAYIDHLMDIRTPERLDWRPLPPMPAVTLKNDRELRRLDKYRGNRRKYNVSATCTGRFEHGGGKLVAIRATGSRNVVLGPLRYGHMGAWDSQLVLQSVSNVAAKPIDRSIYEKNR
jgi:hypothetical protein